MSKFQATLALLKPDVTANPVACRWIIQKIYDKNLSVEKEKKLNWKKRDSEEFYKQHQGKFFYQRLIEYTSCGPIIALLLTGHNAIQSWRQIMGPTKAFQAKLNNPYTIRGVFGLSDTRNSSHGSDSQQSLNEEIQLVFPEFDFNKWWEHKCQENVMKQNYSNTIGLSCDPSQDRIDQGFRIAESTTTSNKMKSNVEWFVSYAELRSSILPLIQESARHIESKNPVSTVIDIGCGNSMVGPFIALDLVNTEIYCMDFDIEGLKSLQKRVNKNEKLKDSKNCFFVHHDITFPLPFYCQNVDAIIDKGTTDAIIKQKGLQYANKALSNMLKSLKNCGILIQITDEPPEVHVDLLQTVVNKMPNCNFHISCKELSHSIPFEYFVYTVTKSNLKS